MPTKMIVAADSGRFQRELDGIEKRANIVRRLLQEFGSAWSQDTQGVEDAILVAEKIEELAILANADNSIDRWKVFDMITVLRNDLQNRVDRLDLPEISGEV